MNFIPIQNIKVNNRLKRIFLMLICSYSLCAYQNNSPCFTYTLNLPTSQTQKNNYVATQQPFLAPIPLSTSSHATKTKKQQKAELEQNLTTATHQYLQSGKNFFKGDISRIEPIIRKAILDKSIEKPVVQDYLKFQVITHLVATSQTDSGKVIPYKNHPWMHNHDLRTVSSTDQIKLNYMISRVSQVCNDTTVELVQAALQAWEQAQHATNSHEKIMHQNMYEKCYNTLKQYVQPSNIACHAPQMQKADITKLLDMYTSEIDTYHAQNNASMQHTDSAYFARLEERKQALLDSEKELTGQLSRENRTYKIDSQTVGFMQACNINYACFDNIGCSRFQHCITNEIVTILKTAADMAARNNYEPVITQFAKHTSNLAVSAQQLNQLSYRQQAAVVLTDLAHFFSEYGQIMVDHDFQLRRWKALGVPIATGAARALYKWVEFAEKLYDDPHKTIGKLSHDCYAVARCLYTIAAEIGRFTPFAYLDDMTRDMQDSLNYIQHTTHSPPDRRSSRMMQRTEQNLQTLQVGLYQAVHIGQAVIGSMMETPWQENIANIAELTTDAFITNKATNCILYLSQFVGSQLIQAGSEMQQMIPSHLLDSSMTFMKTDAGHLIAVADATGENITGAIAIATQAIADSATPFFQFVPQAKNLTDKIDKLTNPNKEEVAALQKSLEPFLRTDKIVNIERLKSIEGVDQIDKFKDYTNNFNNLEKLHPDEILYLNLCDWLKPQADLINAELKSLGGLTIIDQASGQQALIKEFDLFHSLLGEMKPGSVRSTTSGGHCFLTELRAASLSYDEVKAFGNGFFDMQIKPRRGLSASYKDQTYFPAGKSISDCTDILIDAIKNSKCVEFGAAVEGKQIIDITQQSNQKFRLYIENNILRFSPVSPFA